ncbi:MAG: hypothetical protein B7X04_00560 [Parcubacteria group bacterium 21-54-25]|nr:MAG: hypothetical protein B7X04_00560 [Parcubacteria group bacterium 21-54-25]HQU07454.1 glycosyltransferase [Candidatus Paceibacterota bacterium]
MKRVLFFGIFDPDYARSRVLCEGFEANGYTVEMCRVDPRAHRGVRKYLMLFRQGRVRKKEHFEYIFVLFPGHTVVWLARLLFGKRIIFDAFVSLYNSNVHDRTRYVARSLPALRDRLFDWSSCALAGTVLVDTQAHRQYFIARHLASPKKTLVVPVGASQAWFEAETAHAPQAKHKTITVGFYGTYIPLQGIDSIVRAAATLSRAPLRFEIIGSGQDTARIAALIKELGGLPNVTFIPRISRDELIERVRCFDINLGIFGTTEKAQRVVPNKVYEAAALGKAVITADTPAAREIFSEKEVILVPSGDPSALAKAIRSLAADLAQRRLIATAARELMVERYTPDKIVANLLKELPH